MPSETASSAAGAGGSVSVRRSFCPLDCPDACSLQVRVEEGRVVRLDGDRRNPVTGGFICRKVRHFPERLYGPERLLHPGVREGAKGEGCFRPASWDEALDRVVAAIAAARDRYGAEAILPVSYGGSNGFLTQGTTDERFFFRLGASRLARTVCTAPSDRAEEAMYGGMPGVAPEDYAEARLIVIWGANPSVSSIHLVPHIREARRRGARLVVVDPRATPLARQADLHLPVRPGTDLPVALAVIRRLFELEAADGGFLAAHTRGAEELQRRAAGWTPERAAREAGVEAADIDALAHLLATASPAVVRCGWGTERNRNGGSAVAAVLALPAVVGAFGVRGGGYTLSNHTAWKELHARDAARAEEPPTRRINMNRLGRALTEELEPPLAVLFVYDCNPLSSLPDQRRVRSGLERQDLFTVVFDQVLTDTARYADLVLPATTFLEHAELRRGYGAVAFQEAAPAVAPLGEARPNYEVFAELCRRLGLHRPGDPEGAEALRAAILDSGGRGAELAATLAAEGIVRPPGGRPPVQLVDVFPGTPDGKIDLCPEALDDEASGGLYAYRPDPASPSRPLALISPATNRTVSTMLGELHRRVVPLHIHPGDAAVRGISDGDLVAVANDLAEVRCPARLDSGLRPGVVYLPKGLWSHNTLDGETANALVPDALTDLAGGACFNDARVQVRKL